MELGVNIAYSVLEAGRYSTGKAVLDCVFITESLLDFSLREEDTVVVSGSM